MSVKTVTVELTADELQLVRRGLSHLWVDIKGADQATLWRDTTATIDDAVLRLAAEEKS